MTKIAVLGLGAMGVRMARRLLDGGCEVTVWNRSAERAAPLAALGAHAASTPRAAAQGADIVLAMLRDDEASREVWLHPETGALAAMRADALAIDSSTLTVGCVRDLAGAAAAREIGFLDAPVSGSRPQAEAGQLIYLVGGDAEALAKAEPALKLMGGAIHHIGPCGSGALAKLAVNAMFGVQVAAVAELIGLLRKSGADAAVAIDALAATPVFSPVAKGLAATILAGNYAPSFPLELAEKDFRYLGDAAAYGAAIPVSTCVGAVMAQGLARGLGAEQLTAVAKLYGDA